MPRTERSPAAATSPRSAIVVPPLENEPFWLDLARGAWQGVREMGRLLFMLAGAGFLVGIVIAIAIFVVRALT